MATQHTADSLTVELLREILADGAEIRMFPMKRLHELSYTMIAEKEGSYLVASISTRSLLVATVSIWEAWADVHE